MKKPIAVVLAAGAMLGALADYKAESKNGYTWIYEQDGEESFIVGVAEVPDEYSVKSDLRIGAAHGGGWWSDRLGGKTCTEREIWEVSHVTPGEHEFAFIEVYGQGEINPVVFYGDMPVECLGLASVWTDQKVFDTFTPPGLAASKWKSRGGDESSSYWAYKSADGTDSWKWKKFLWPDRKVVADRRWIVVPVKKAGAWPGNASFRVGIAGTSAVSDNVFVRARTKDVLNLNPNDFFYGVTMSGVEKFDAMNDGALWWDDTMGQSACAQGYEIGNNALSKGKPMSLVVSVPCAGTLVVASGGYGSDGEDELARKEQFAVSGSGIISDNVHEFSTEWDDWNDTNYYATETNLWKTSKSTSVRRIAVSGKTSITFTRRNKNEESAAFKRLNFFPRDAKSVAVWTSYVSAERNTWEEYYQGYVVGNGVYKSGETAVLTAIAGAGEQFDHWEVHFGNLTLTEEQKKSPTLSFEVTDSMCGGMEDEEQIFLRAVWKPKYEIVALPSIVGAGTVIGTGRYHEGTVVTLTATAADGCSFIKWSDGETSPTRQIEVVAADVEHVFYACFDAPNGVPVGGGTSDIGGEVDTSFAKAQTVDGVLYGSDGNVAGIVQVKVGKKSKKDVVSVSASATLMNGKKISAKSAKMTIAADGTLSGELSFNKPIGAMYFEMEEGGAFTLAGDGYFMAVGDIGGSLPDGTMTFLAGIEGLPDFGGGWEVVADALPIAVAVKVANGRKLDAGKAASPKYAKFSDKAGGATWFELTGFDDPKKPNASGLKLTYTPKTGMLKGSFKMYATNAGSVAAGKKPTLKNYTVNISGFVVDGKGVCTATLKKPAASWPAALE